MSLTNEEIIDEVTKTTILETTELIKKMEEKFGTSAFAEFNSSNKNESSSSSTFHPIAPGTKVRVLYEGESFTGKVEDYFKTSSGGLALAVNINVNAGTQIKGFLARKKPVITLL